MARIGIGKIETKDNQNYYDPTIVFKALTSAISSFTGEGSGTLDSFIKEDSRVLIKPNFVNHSDENIIDKECIVTNTQVIVEVIKKVSACNPYQIVLGDAPIQGCNWAKLLTSDMRASFEDAAGTIPFIIKDFRRTILSDGIQAEGINPINEYLLFDLAEDSYLEEISRKKNKFRVTMYDHRKLNARHAKGKHQYLVAKDAINADVVISLPKLKTHKKAGLTGALKNLVGITGNKEFLPHHRKGGTSSGGDCYPGRSIVKSFLESLEDYTYMYSNKLLRKSLNICKRVVYYIYRRISSNDNIEGNWYGNDTVWRTTLDLNRILYYGTKDGLISNEPQRIVLSITDAIICGQGEGPLSPTPLYVGAITVTDRPDIADYFHALMLGILPERIPLIVNARSLFDNDDSCVVCNGANFREDDSLFINVSARMPKGWQEYNSKK